MNYVECREVIQEVIATLRQVPSNDAHARVNRFLAVGKLEAVLDGWPDEAEELQRLQRFEKNARAVLGSCYGIENSRWTIDGHPVELRLLNNKDVMEVLRCDAAASEDTE